MGRDDRGAVIGFVFTAASWTLRTGLRVVAGPDVADQCGGHDDSPESCYADSVGIYRCGVCAMKLEA